MFGPIFKGIGLASTPTGRKVIRHAIRLARSSEGKKVIAQARKVAASPEGRKLIGEATKLAARASKAANAPSNRARVKDVARAVRRRGR